jgi:alkanesulfonate monooxygenase SsuD/methylene tetrahydromethanopterin reductase-like flavin-dependent oxidoreductase (luciferase family)
MSEREFRFGVVAGPAPSGAAWAGTARQAERLGFDILLVPDTRHTLAPFAALATAAAVTERIKIGTYVLSAPNRSPGLVAWETRSLQLLSGGRFELGLGGGRPDAERDAVALGGSFGTPGERFQRVADTVEAVREASPETPILVAASKPRMLRLAEERADVVALGLPPDTTEDHLAHVAAHVTKELHLNLAAVAESAAAVPEGVSRMVGGDPRQMAAAGGIAFLLGSPAEMAATLHRRRAEFGVSYIGVNALFMEAFAPVLDLLKDDR